MRPITIVFDLDNTIFDTSIRKLSLLKKALPSLAESIRIAEVRQDFHLTSVLGEPGNTVCDNFLSN